MLSGNISVKFACPLAPRWDKHDFGWRPAVRKGGYRPSVFSNRNNGLGARTEALSVKSLDSDAPAAITEDVTLSCRLRQSGREGLIAVGLLGHVQTLAAQLP